MHLASKIIALGGLFLSAAACGGGTATGGTGATGGSSTTSSGPSVAMACADQAHAACTERDKCSTNYNNKKVYGDEATCEMRTALTCPTSLAANGTTQTPAHIEACVAAYPGYACADFFDGNPPSACIPPVGTLANGKACGASGQCTSTFCAIAQYQTCGTCAPLPAVGAACQVQADCGRNLACATPAGATSGTCAAFVASGGNCLTGVAPCAAGLSCMGDDTMTMTMGKCQAAGAASGAMCDGTRKTMPACDPEQGLVCIPTAKGSAVGTCQAVQLVAGGMPCGDIGAMPITGFAVCEAGGLCVKAAPANPTGTCKAPAPDSMPCDSDPTKGPPCLPPAKCVPSSSTGTAGTCTVPDATKCM